MLVWRRRVVLPNLLVWRAGGRLDVEQVLEDLVSRIFAITLAAATSDDATLVLKRYFIQHYSFVILELQVSNAIYSLHKQLFFQNKCSFRSILLFPQRHDLRSLNLVDALQEFVVQIEGEENVYLAPDAGEAAVRVQVFGYLAFVEDAAGVRVFFQSLDDLLSALILVDFEGVDYDLIDEDVGAADLVEHRLVVFDLADRETLVTFAHGDVGVLAVVELEHDLLRI